MPNEEEPSPDPSLDLSRLEKDYEILTELHREDGSRIFLARHLGLDRDVTITISQAPGDDDKALVHFAADARLLANIQHPNLTQVIEGVWLDEHTLAVIRERANGSTLDQLISAAPVPADRVSTIVEQIYAALDRARSDGVVHRNVTPRSVVLEQGNGRVLVSLEPGPLSGDVKPDEGDDARTIGRLASEMLSGAGPVGDNEESSSAENASASIAREIVEALEEIKACDRSSASRALGALVTALKPTAESSTNGADSEKSAVARDSTPVAEGRAGPPSRLPARPRRRAREKAIVAAPSFFGFNSRMGIAIVVVAITGAAGLFAFRQRNARDPRLAVSANDTQQAGGDIAPKRRSDSATARTSSPPITASRPIAQPIVTASETLRTRPKPETTSTVTSPPPQTTDTSSTAIPRPRIAPPDTPRHEPPKTAPPLTLPLSRDSTDTTAQKPPPDSVAAAPAPAPAPTRDTTACASTAADDQQRCLTAAIDQSDRAVNAVLARVISGLRRQAGAADGDPDPPAVEQLRAAQRTWVDDRNAACRDARGRSACFAEQTTNRTRELQKMLDAIPPSS